MTLVALAIIAVAAAVYIGLSNSSAVASSAVVVTDTVKITPTKVVTAKKTKAKKRRSAKNDSTAKEIKKRPKTHSAKSSPTARSYVGPKADKLND